MNKAYLLIGGNMGDRKLHLQQAVNHIGRACGEITSASHRYETAAWGKTNQPSFLNQALALKTLLSPLELLHAVLRIETDMGRRRQEKFGPRIIDIDILFYNDEVIDHPALQVPHPALQNRRFVLDPMTEIAATLRHPVLHKTIYELLMECTDTLEVKKLEN